MVADCYVNLLDTDLLMFGFTGFLQVDCWLSVISGGYNYHDLLRNSSHLTPWQKVLPAEDSDPTLEYVI